MSPLRMAAFAALAPAISSPIAAQQPPAPAEFTISVSNYAFAPRPIHLAAGRPVTLTFTNRSGGSHDFTAAQFFHDARILSGAVVDGKVALKGHQSVSVTLVPAAGRYQAHCSHFMHQTMGMTDEIIVD